MICPMCNKEAYSFSNGDWYCPHCNNGVGSSRRVPIKQTTGYITNSNKDLAIECLKEVKEAIEDNCKKGCFKNLGGEMFGKFLDCDNIMIFIDNKIKELEEEK